MSNKVTAVEDASRDRRRSRNAKSPAPRTGLVLSGGGARGAYEAGLVAGIIEVLGLRPADRAPFRVFAGTSVGALNATYLAAHADQGDMAIGGLLEQWRGLTLESHLRLDPLGLLGWPRTLPLLRLRHLLDSEHLGERYGRSVLDPRPFDEMVAASVDWDRLHENIQRGDVHSLVLAALNVGSGRTHMFAELSPGAEFRESNDPRRMACIGPLHPDHVLASAAIPLLFPARRVGDAYFCDGGLRFNTPLSPAIRTGADRLVVVALMHRFRPDPRDAIEQYPSLLFLLGKILGALLLDPVEYDLQLLGRFNQLHEVLEEALTDTELHHVQEMLLKTRGAPYRRLDVLAFHPSLDIGMVAGDFLKSRSSHPMRITEYLLGRAARTAGTFEADLASFVLFDGGFAERLIQLGLADARSNATEIREFLR